MLRGIKDAALGETAEEWGTALCRPSSSTALANVVFFIKIVYPYAVAMRANLWNQTQ
jgi:hypothetical protein